MSATPRRWGGLLAALGVIWLALMIRRLYAMPLMSDEVVTASIAEMPFGAVEPDGAHPPLLTQCITFMAQTLQLHAESLRWLGLTCWLLTAGIVWRVGERWARHAGWWCVALFAVSPLAVQGALMLCIDNTLLTLWMAGVIGWLSQRQLPLRGRDVVVLGLLWFAGLWTKFTTPLLLPPLLWLVYAARGRAVRGFRDIGLMCLVGGAAFLAGWRWYSELTGVPYWWFVTGRNVGVVHNALQHLAFSELETLVHRLLRVVLFLTPPAVLLWAWAAWDSGRRWREPAHRDAEKLALLMSGGICVGYLLIGGMVAGFPKYQVPLTPLIALLGGVALQRTLGQHRLPAALVVAVLLGTALYTWGVVGDLLYLLTQSVRWALVFAPTTVLTAVNTFSMHLLWQAALVVLVAVAVRIWPHGHGRRPWPVVVAATLALAALGSQLGTAAAQLLAPYATHYMYGRSLATYRASIEFLAAFHRQHPTARLLVPWDVYYHAVGPAIYPVPPESPIELWDAQETPEQLVARFGTVGCVMVDPDYNFSHTLRDVLPDARVQEALARDFKRHTIGAVTVWTRAESPAR